MNFFTSLEEELYGIDGELLKVDSDIRVLNEKRRRLTERKRTIERTLAAESSSNDVVAKWDRHDFPWSSKISKVASEVFGITSFRELQLPCINTTMSKSDCILIIPTGGGKSLCFQLSAVLSSGWTLVISPLISLMEDQVMNMQKLKIDTRLLSATTEKTEQKQILNDMINPTSSLKLLYVTPERLAKSKMFMNKLEKAHQLGLLARIAIDEVHCCSHWGHDFRPDYKFLNILKPQFPGVPLLCLTATASSDVIEDVKKLLNLSPSTIVFRASFNRANLFYEVLEKPSNAKKCYDMMADLIRRDFDRQSGIVYCLSKKDSEEVALELQRRGMKTGVYHADINAYQRTEIHQKWIANKINIVVATIAFGLGIDKPDVRFVIHHSLSKSCENYYQESGRCGRDGKPARCILLYRLADLFRVSCMVFHERNTLPKLYAMLKYASAVDTCRRQIMAEIFGETAPDCHQKCDNCAQRFCISSLDCSPLAAELMPELFPNANATNRLTFLKALDKLSKTKAAKSSGLSAVNLEKVFAQMLLDGSIKEDFHFTPYSTISYLVPTSTGARQLERGCLSVTVKIVEKIKLKRPRKVESSEESIEESNNNKKHCLMDDDNYATFKTSSASPQSACKKLEFVETSETQAVEGVSDESDDLIFV